MNVLVPFRCVGNEWMLETIKLCRFPMLLSPDRIVKELELLKSQSSEVIKGRSCQNVRVVITLELSYHQSCYNIGVVGVSD
jgi:hypothetical protein